MRNTKLLSYLVHSHVRSLQSGFWKQGSRPRSSSRDGKSVWQRVGESGVFVPLFGWRDIYYVVLARIVCRFVRVRIPEIEMIQFTFFYIDNTRPIELASSPALTVKCNDHK